MEKSLCGILYICISKKKTKSMQSSQALYQPDTHNPRCTYTAKLAKVEKLSSSSQVPLGTMLCSPIQVHAPYYATLLLPQVRDTRSVTPPVNILGAKHFFHLCPILGCSSQSCCPTLNSSCWGAGTNLCHLPFLDAHSFHPP